MITSIFSKATLVAVILGLYAGNLLSQSTLECNQSVFTPRNSITHKQGRAINTYQYDIDLQRPYKENCVSLDINTRVDSYKDKGGTYTVLLKEGGRVIKRWQGQHQTKWNKAVVSVNAANYNQFSIEIVEVVNCYPKDDYPIDTPFIEVHNTSLKEVFQE
ncbi:MAG: hypothetical protein R3A50_09935 [Saprospiraceae bacterium]